MEGENRRYRQVPEEQGYSQEFSSAAADSIHSVLCWRCQPSYPHFLFSCLYDHIFAENFKIMSRGRGKGKKLNVNHEDAGSGEDEKLPTQKRRRRPQKPLKDEFDDEEVEKVECLRVYVF